MYSSQDLEGLAVYTCHKSNSSPVLYMKLIHIQRQE